MSHRNKTIFWARVKFRSSNGNPLFQDKDCSLSTGSFTCFAVVCLNDQSQPGSGQFCVMRGAHHAMETFYRMQKELGGIMGPEGPGWPRFDHRAPNRCGMVQVPRMVREVFLDKHAEPDATGQLWPQPTQCCMHEGDVCIALHSLPHSASRNEGTVDRQNLIWRIRSKSRQPDYVHNGLTDHPDRWCSDGSVMPANGAWLNFDQKGPPYFPGEQRNDPHERSKYALTHIWCEIIMITTTIAPSIILIHEVFQ